MGGDTWHSGECNVICPKCHVRHRLLSEKSIKKYQKLRQGIWANEVYVHRLEDYDGTFYVAGSKESIGKYQGITLAQMQWVNI